LLTYPRFLITIAPDMKTQLNTSPIFTQGIQSSQVSNMDMDLEGMKQACQIFRDNIYTDKILAVVREWVSNAVDEHLKHSIKQPVETGVKEGRFFVRDFAKGLDDNGIRNVFGKYFRSTKSDSDQPIGGFGVGAKAGHCYQDAFYVSSFHNGIKTIYSCILGGDESGASIGQVIEMSQEPTTESGLLVEIEIKEDRVNNGDTGTFAFYSYIMASTATLAEIKVVDDSGYYKNPNNKTLILEKDGIRFYSFDDAFDGNREYMMTMGGVKYNTPKSFNGFAFQKDCEPLTTIQIDVPVGFFEVPISREFFRETAKFTNGIQKCEAILSEFINQQKESIGKLQLSDLCIGDRNTSPFFKFKKSSFIPAKVALSLNKIHLNGRNKPLIKHKNKVFVAIVSNLYSYRNDQLAKLQKYCEANGVSALFVQKEDMQYICDAVDQHQVDSDLEFRPIASLFPKQKGSGGRMDDKFSIYRRGNRSPFRASALELHNLHWNTDHSIDEAKHFLAEILQSTSLSRFQNIILMERGFQKIYSFSSIALKKDLASLGYVVFNDQATQDLLKKLTDLSKKEAEASCELHRRYSACKNLLADKTQKILLRKINHDVYNPKLSKALNCIERIAEELKNNKNELVSTFTNLALKNYYFQPCRSDVRKFIKAAK
jgi:hypothetical protein